MSGHDNADDPVRKLSRRHFLAGTAAAALTVGLEPAGAWAAAGGDPIRPLTLTTKTQVVDPAVFQAVQMIAQEWKKLGLKINLQVVPRSQMTEIVVINRNTWDSSSWEMVGRPERSDPDELIFTLLHSSLARSGYNFAGYQSPEYDKLVEAQRAEIDVAKRRELVKKAQLVLARDQPFIPLVHPRRPGAFNADVWDEKTIVEEAGIGIRNFWTFIGATPKGEQKDMILNAPQPVMVLNPVRMDGIGSWVTDILWDHLVRVDKDGEPTAWAAESFKFVDGTTVECVIREGMKFHDGTPVTMEDVKYSFELPATPGKCPQFAPFVSNIAGIEITGPRTIVFKLKTNQASFFTGTLAKINLVPKHVWEPIVASLANSAKLVEDFQQDVPIGSGPFKFASWRRQEETVLERFADHWAAPKMSRWILRTVPNQEATLGMLRNGEINFLANFTGDPETVLALAKQSPNIKVVITTDLGFQFILLNNRRAPFSDPAFRRALSMTVNRELLAAAAWNGFAEPAGSSISTALPNWHEQKALVKGGDLKAAKKILEEAGYTWRGGQLCYPAGKKEDLAVAN